MPVNKTQIDVIATDSSKAKHLWRTWSAVLPFLIIDDEGLASLVHGNAAAESALQNWKESIKWKKNLPRENIFLIITYYYSVRLRQKFCLPF